MLLVFRLAMVSLPLCSLLGVTTESWETSASLPHQMALCGNNVNSLIYSAWGRDDALTGR